MKRSIMKIAGLMAMLAGEMHAMTLTAGDQVPDIAVPSTGGGELNLRSLSGGWTVLYFYPKSFTPGCTKQACGLRDGKASLDELGAVVIGVSTDNVKAQEEFKAKHNLPFEILADEDKKLSEAFGVLGVMGMSKRVTFIIGPDGIITDVIDSVSVGTHDEDVTKLLKARQGK